MPTPADLVQQQTNSTGSGNLTLAVVNGRQTFSAAFGTGGSNTFDYFISNESAVEWERGTGHVNVDNITFVRDTVLESSNANLAINFSSGVKDVVNDIPAASQYFIGGPTVHLADGGTGQTTANAAFNALSPLTTTGDTLTFSGGVNARLPVGTVGQVLQSTGTAPAYAIGMTIVPSTANQTVTSSIALVNDTVLKFSVSANTIYGFKFVLCFTYAAAGGFLLQLTGPAAPTSVVYTALINDNVTQNAAFVQSAFSQSTNSTVFNTSATAGFFIYEGVLQNGSNAGTVQLQFAQGVSSGTATTRLAGSYVRWAII